MNKTGIILLAAVTAFTSYNPANALPAAPLPQAQTSDVNLVQHREHRNARNDYRQRNGRSDRRPEQHWRGEAAHHREGWHNGHRGYRDRRPGYRRDNDGWWYPLAAFGAGAIIGGAITAPAKR